MGYATAAQFRQAFGDAEATQLANRGTGGTADAILLEFLDRASLEIDSRLALRYATPVAATASTLRVACMDIARYRLFDDAAPEVVRDRFEDALRWLADLAAGRAALVLDSGAIAPAPDPVTTPTAAAPAVGVPRTLVYGESFQGRYGPSEWLQ